MNTNDLPLAQKLAAIMEAGRAAHPNVKHIRWGWGNGRDYGCAMTFALLGAGCDVLNVGDVSQALAEKLGAPVHEIQAIARRVISMNDDSTATLEEIIAAVREERLPEAKEIDSAPSNVKVISLDEFTALYPPKAATAYFSGVMKSYTWIGVDMANPEVIEVKKIGEPKPDKAVRVSAKTGASWPKPKHAYA